MALLRYKLILFFVFNGSSLFSQTYKNNIYISGGNVFFPDWAPRTNCFGVGYSNKISNDWQLQGQIFACISNENPIYESSKEFSYKTVYYNEIWYRNLIVFDVKGGYELLHDQKNNFFLFINGGLSFIYGEEKIIKSIWYGSFSESDLTTNYRHHPGVNGGFQFGYYPLKHFGIGVFSTGHIYTKYDPDINIGASIYFRFGGSTSSS